MRDWVKVIAMDAMLINKGLPFEKPRYTHLWGNTKTNTAYMAKVRMSLMDMDIDLFMRVHKFCKENEL
jgi:hypothetical protein